MSIVKNPTAASIANRLGNRIHKQKGKVIAEPGNSDLLKKLKDLQRTFIILTKEAYYTII